jgi:hypothetical protein
VGSQILDIRNSRVALSYFGLHKAHSAMEAALLCKELNPRVAWCFAAESFMGVCRLLALKSNKSHQGEVPSCNLLMQKYCVGMFRAMEDPDMFFFAFDDRRIR